MSDQNLDKLFKNGLSERDVTFNMDSWRKMEQMLPPEPVAVGFRYGKIAAVIGTLFVLSASWFVWNNTNVEEYEPRSVENLETLEEFTNSATYSESVDANSANVHSKNATELNKENKKRSESTDAKIAEVIKANELNKNVSSSIPRKNNFKKAAPSSIANTPSQPGSTEPKNIKAKNNLFFAQNENFESLTIDNNSENEAQPLPENYKTVSVEALKVTELNRLKPLSLENEGDQTLFAELANSKLPTVNRSEIGFLGGLNLAGGLMKPTQNGMSGCEVLGLTYQRYFNGGFSLMANLLYAPRNEINGQKQFERKTYGFGSFTEQKMMESHRLVYLDLPIMINYNVGNHNFQAGTSLSYLITGLHKISTEVKTQTETTIDENMEWGYTEGFKKIDFALVAGYEYTVQPKLNLGVRLNYGLLDVTNNKYFDSSSFDNNVQFRVYLKYAPFQF